MGCGWCGSPASGSGSNCARCGGPLAAPSEAGAPPPARPRPLPAGFARRELFAANSGVWIGLIWVGFTGIFPLIFASVSLANPAMAPAALLSLIFPVPGLIITGLSVRRARRRLHVLQEGRAVIGRIDEVGPDRSETVNGAHPTRVAYLFEVDGRRYGGSVSSFDAAVAAIPVGRDVHVVYLPEDPERNDIWPLVPR